MAQLSFETQIRNGAIAKESTLNIIEDYKVAIPAAYGTSGNFIIEAGTPIFKQVSASGTSDDWIVSPYDANTPANTPLANFIGVLMYDLNFSTTQPYASNSVVKVLRAGFVWITSVDLVNRSNVMVYLTLNGTTGTDARAFFGTSASSTPTAVEGHYLSSTGTAGNVEKCFFFTMEKALT